MYQIFRQDTPVCFNYIYVRGKIKLCLDCDVTSFLFSFYIPNLLVMVLILCYICFCQY